MAQKQRGHSAEQIAQIARKRRVKNVPKDLVQSKERESAAAYLESGR